MHRLEKISLQSPNGVNGASKRGEWSLQTWWMEPPNDVNGASKQALAASRCAT